MKGLAPTWIVLLGLTLAAWGLGAGLEGLWLPMTVLGLAAVKGQLVIDRFMELAHAPRLFRVAVSAWLWTMLTLVLAIGWWPR